MLGRVTASEVIREAKSGRTKPVLMLCEADANRAVDRVRNARDNLDGLIAEIRRVLQ